MNRAIRRTATTVGLTLYFVWLLAVVGLVITRFTPGPIPTIVDRVVVAGGGVGFVIGLVRIVSRTPRYVEKIRKRLS